MKRCTSMILTATLIATASTGLLAHMKLARSLPAADSTVSSPPAQIQVWFTQMPDVKVSRLALEGPAGPVKLGSLSGDKDKSIAAAVAGTMTDGAYTVKWQAAGDDGHIQRGSFTFTLRKPPPR